MHEISYKFFTRLKVMPLCVKFKNVTIRSNTSLGGTHLETKFRRMNQAEF